MQAFIAKVALKDALNAVGCGNGLFPTFFDARTYDRQNEDDVKHVVVAGGEITVHSYSSDPRERYARDDFESLPEFIRHFVGKQISDAAALYIATEKAETIKKIQASGNPMEFFRERDAYVSAMTARLDAHLGGMRFFGFRMLFAVARLDAIRNFSKPASRSERRVASTWLWVRRTLAFTLAFVCFGAGIFNLFSDKLFPNLEDAWLASVVLAVMGLSLCYFGIFGKASRYDYRQDIELHKQNKERYRW